MNPRFSEKWQFVISLYASLDIKIVLGRLQAELQSSLACEHLCFSNSDLHVVVTHGFAKEYELSYRLEFETQYLGDLTISRRDSFTDQEIDSFEEYISLLLQPLSNAVTYQKAEQRALQDPLTGLFNRRALLGGLARELDLADRQDKPLSILALDIDHFKDINDTAGHLAGDYYLQVFADKLVELCRESDLIYRSGGEEFLIILSNTDHEGAAHLARRIIEGIAELKCHYKDKVLATTVSIGMSTKTPSQKNATVVLESVDQALYLAKQQGRNRAVRYTEAVT